MSSPVDIIDSKFQSSDNVSVISTTVTAKEWAVVKAHIAELEATIEFITGEENDN